MNYSDPQPSGNRSRQQGSRQDSRSYYTDSAQLMQRRRQQSAKQTAQRRREQAAKQNAQHRSAQNPQQAAQRRSAQASQQQTQRRSVRASQQQTQRRSTQASQQQYTGTRAVLHNIRMNYLRMYRSHKWKIPSLLLFPIAMLYYELLLRIYSGNSFFSHLGYPIFFGLALGLLLSAVCAVLPKKISRRVSLVLLYLLSLIFTVACMVYANYKVYMSLGSIFSGAGNITAQYKSELFLSIIKGIPTIFLYFLPAIFYTCTGRRRVPAKRYAPAFGGALLVLSLCIFGIAALAGSHGATKIIYQDGSFDTRTQTFGLLTAMRLDLGSGSSSTDFVTETTPSETPAAVTAAAEVSVEEEPVTYGVNEMDIDFDSVIASGDDVAASISEYVESLTPSSQNAYTGLFEGKNLILITAEAFSGVCVNEELTPTLYRLIHNGIYFSDFYQPAWGGSTSSGEFSLVFGIAPEDGTETVLDTASNNNYFTMGNQLQRLDYYSAAYHNGVYDTYNRDQTHTNLGYATWTAMENGLEDLVGWDETDTTMFDKTLDTYIDMQPFSIYYMTISGHCPYLEDSIFVEEYYDEVKAYYGDQYKETTLYYLCYQQELENAMTLLIQRLEDAGIADNTVICMVGDHYPYGLQESDAFRTDQDYLLDLYGEDYNDFNWNRDRNDAILWCGSFENEDKDMACEISTPTFSLDLLPTLSNMFGVEYDSRLLVGRDVFSDQEALVFWNDYSWATEYGKFDYGSQTFFPNSGYEQYADDQDYIDRINTMVANKINYSGKVVSDDYWGTLFGPDTVTDNPSWVAERQQELEAAAASTEAADGTDTTAADGTGTTTADTAATDTAAAETGTAADTATAANTG